jgi:hypothetical protein
MMWEETMVASRDKGDSDHEVKPTRLVNRLGAEEKEGSRQLRF